MQTTLLFSAVAVFGFGAADDEVCPAGGACQERVGRGGSSEYPWPKRGGGALSNSFTPHESKVDITAAPSWVWPNAGDEINRHSPSIDAELNVYTVTGNGWVRKFSSSGQLLWSWRTTSAEGKIMTNLALYNDSIHFVSLGDALYGEVFEPRWIGGFAFSLSMQTGELLWRADLPEYFQEPDSKTVFALDGVLAFSMRDRVEYPAADGQNKVVAISSTDGHHLWDYDFDGVVWNFMPASPGDGSLLFATNGGNAHRVDLQTGKPIWKSNLLVPEDVFLGTGGGVLGPDGRFYVAANWFSWKEGEAGSPLEGIAPCKPPEGDSIKTSEEAIIHWLTLMSQPSVANHALCPEGPGLFLVYRVSDGRIEQKRRMPLQLNQYPAVGMLDGSLAVVLGMGTNGMLATHVFPWIEQFLPSFLKSSLTLKAIIFDLQYQFAWLRKLMNFQPYANNTVAAFDAETGRQLWSYTEAPWDHFSGAGDEEGLVRRFQRAEAEQEDRFEVICGPDAWAIPVITGDGTVYAGSGHGGNLYAIRDKDGNGELDPTEVSLFAPGQCWLNSPAVAPGLLVGAPCWGPIYAWKVDAHKK